MKTVISLLLAVLLVPAAQASAAQTSVQIECNTPRGACPPPPPAPPAPPVPPVPPAPGMPPPPPIPAPPPPPPPPQVAMPEIPASAHAACAQKTDGARLTLRLGPNETMSGVCERENGKMVFQLRNYRLHQ